MTLTYVIQIMTLNNTQKVLAVGRTPKIMLNVDGTVTLKP